MFSVAFFLCALSVYPHLIEYDLYCIPTHVLPHVLRTRYPCSPQFECYLLAYLRTFLIAQTNLGTADLRTGYTPRPYELSVSTYQMVILLQFNDAEEIPFKCVIIWSLSL